MMNRTETAAPAADLAGLVLRPYAGEADIPEMVRIRNAEWEADGLTYRETVEELAAYHGHPSDQFRPDRDVTIAELDGRMVGYGSRQWVDTNDGLREHRVGGAVDPAYRRRGIGSALLAENEARSRELAGAQPTERPTVLGMFTDDRNVGAGALATGAGYAAARWFFDMERADLDRELPELPPLPEGIEVRPVTEADLLTIWRADVEAFRDHWGGGDDSEEAFLRYRDAPDFDPSAWVVAWDGDEVAGAVINTIYAAENATAERKRGWLDSVFTRRAWRKRGIAAALIARSLHVLADRGVHVAVLGVDADNPSGALRLYESAGFHTTERGTAWRKPMGGDR
jgi:mycothiol synthase